MYKNFVAAMTLTAFAQVLALAESPKTTNYRAIEDQKLAQIMEHREKDWRNGAVVYQIIVDRFAPAENLASKAHLYTHPRTLKKWEETPQVGQPAAGTENWTHELEFWGGDLQSLETKIDYVRGLGIDVIYLNPIHTAFTNHKYDALDYHTISPEYGSREDLKTLTEKLHARGMKLVLDGVFNHMGSKAPIFQDALRNPESPYRDWFFFGDQYRDGYRSWIDTPALPELRLENTEVQDFIFASKNSVVRSYLRDGIDGWRLDVAFDVGPKVLNALTSAAHEERPGSLIIGEIWNYPDGWFQFLDGVMNFPARKIIIKLVGGEITGTSASKMIDTMISDAGIDGMLKSWLLLDNHDTKRLNNMLTEPWQQEMAQILQFTLPGSPNLYYGTEIGMTGGEDPLNRSPMRWDLVSDKNPHLIRTKALISLHQQERALKLGNYRKIVADQLFAFERYTDKALETVFIIANPSDKAISETLMTRNWKMMNGTPLHDVFSGEKITEIRSGFVDITLPPHTIKVMKPREFENDWSPYARVN